MEDGKMTRETREPWGTVQWNDGDDYPVERVTVAEGWVELAWMDGGPGYYADDSALTYEEYDILNGMVIDGKPTGGPVERFVVDETDTVAYYCRAEHVDAIRAAIRAEMDN
jgi:hypothetical protein